MQVACKLEAVAVEVVQRSAWRLSKWRAINGISDGFTSGLTKISGSRK